MVTANKLPKGPERALREFALTFPGAYEEFPWGERVMKVKGKVFAFMGTDSTGFGMTAKLPHTGLMALGLPFAEPTGYNLGKSGWVSASFGKRESVPLKILKSWIEESYEAVAPKKLFAQWQEKVKKPAPKRASPTKKRGRK